VKSSGTESQTNSQVVDISSTRTPDVDSGIAPESRSDSDLRHWRSEIRRETGEVSWKHPRVKILRANTPVVILAGGKARDFALHHRTTEAAHAGRQYPILEILYVSSRIRDLKT